MPASTTNVAAARPSRNPTTRDIHPSSTIGSEDMTSAKWTTTIPRIANARARSYPMMRSGGEAVSAGIHGPPHTKLSDRLNADVRVRVDAHLPRNLQGRLDDRLGIQRRVLEKRLGGRQRVGPAAA